MTNINTLNDDIYYTILYNTNKQDIINLCNSNKHLHNLCNSNFWKLKIQLDYPIVKLKSNQYQEEYERLTYLYDKAEHILSILEFSPQSVSFFEDGEGFRVRRMYWISKFKPELSNSSVIRIIISNKYEIQFRNISTNFIVTKEISRQTVINIFWLLMYHYDVIISTLSGKPIQ